MITIMQRKVKSAESENGRNFQLLRGDLHFHRYFRGCFLIATNRPEDLVFKNIFSLAFAFLILSYVTYLRENCGTAASIFLAEFPYSWRDD